MSDSDPVPSIAIDGTTSTEWIILHVEVDETVFDGYRVHVRAAMTDAAADLDGWIGKDATVILRTTGGERSFHGVLFEITEIAASPTERTIVDVVVGARFELLKLGRDHRWFQEKSVPEIVREVLDGAGLADKCEWSINGTYEPREYVVQYGESDFDFITRLLHEEGIGFYIRDAADSETYVFFDDDSAFEVIEGESILHDRMVALTAADTVSFGEDRLRVASDRVMLRDYDLKAPATDLSTNAEAPDSTLREVYSHPGDFTDTGRGQRLTDRLLERLRMTARTISGSSDCVRLAPGRIFTFADSARDALNADYLVLETFHRCEADPDIPLQHGTLPPLVYRCSFRAIPSDVPYRPQYAAPPPRMHGVQPAFATVPGGEEIHADENGRAKARFVWDRSGITDDRSSCWMRVGQVALGGSMILPRIDFELLVDSELGDIDRPVITGHLYNADKPPPYALPAGNTRSSFQTATTGGGPGANELRFEDAAGSEEIYINASKDLIASVDNTTNWTVGNNSTQHIGANNTLSVTAAHKMSVTGNRKLTVSGNQSIDVGGDYGDGIGANLSVSIDGNRMLKVGGDHIESAGTTLDRTVDGMQVIIGIAGFQRTVVGAATTNVHAIWAEVCGTARGLSITGSYTENITAAKLIKAKNVSVSCGAAFTMNAAAHIVKSSAGRQDDAMAAVALSGTAFKIKAKNIVFEAQSKLVFRGGAGVIELDSAGNVTVKAPSITVKNSDALNQMMHTSN